MITCLLRQCAEYLPEPWTLVSGNKTSKVRFQHNFSMFADICKCCFQKQGVPRRLWRANNNHDPRLWCVGAAMGSFCPVIQQGVTYSCHFRISLEVCLAEALSPLLFGSDYSHRFSCYLLKALRASCPSSFPSFTPLSHPPYLLLLYFLPCMTIPYTGTTLTWEILFSP